MTTLATKQIPADRYKYILDQQPQWGLETAEVTSMRTDFTSPDELQAEVKSADFVEDSEVWESQRLQF